MTSVTVDPTSQPRALACVEENLEGETVLWNETTGQLHHLNASASMIWRELDGRETLAHIAAALAVMTSSDPDLVLAAVITTTQTFADQGLLQLEED